MLEFEGALCERDNTGGGAGAGRRCLQWGRWVVGSGGKEKTPWSHSRKQGTSPLATGSWRLSCALPSPWRR